MNTAYPFQIEAIDAVRGSEIGKVILPTGAGKSVIQHFVISELIKDNPGFGIYVVATPRILLTNQIGKNLTTWFLQDGVKLRVISVHSGSQITGDEDDPLRHMLADSVAGSTTSTQELTDVITEQKFMKEPILIFSTYHSLDKVTKAVVNCGEKVSQLLCDEAHYVTEEGFFESVADLKAVSARTHFFTATQKTAMAAHPDKRKADTGVYEGRGMTNTSFYGEVIYRKTVNDMIRGGYILPTRLHFVGTPGTAPSMANKVQSAFRQHEKQLTPGYNAKMLVCCAGTRYMQAVVTSTDFMKWAESEGITVFSISSQFGHEINGKPFVGSDYGKLNSDRDQFLEYLRDFNGKAIILHINILTEGIDVPDITGVFFTRQMQLTRFMQSIGRAMRLNLNDKAMGVNNRHLWTKKFAWVILDATDVDMMCNLNDFVKHMREEGFDPIEAYIVEDDAGITEDDLESRIDDGEVRRPRGAIKLILDMFDLEYDIEAEMIANMVIGKEKNAQNCIDVITAMDL